MPQMFASGTSKDLLRLRNDPRRKQKNVDKEDPHNILRHVIKGFDIAYPQDAVTGQEQESTASLRGAEFTAEEMKAWTKPVHPSKPELQLLDSYPVLPDMDAIPQTGFYMVVKFTTNPTITTERYDTRFDAAMFQPLMDTERHEIFKQKMEEWDPDSGKPKPLLDFDYAYYLPEDETSVRGIKRKFNINDPEKDDSELYTDDVADGQRAFKYSRLRTYETYHQSGDPEVFYNDAVALALHDPELEVGAAPGAQKRLAKGAYFYPIAQRAVLRPKRKAAYSQMGAENDAPDELNVTVRELESELEGIREHQARFDPSMVESAA
jgi:RNA polymerase II-associated factor 1